MNEDDFARERDRALNQLSSLVADDTRFEGLWLQGSLARGDADPFSDIDAYVAVDDELFDEVFQQRASLVGSLNPIAWSNASTPGLKGVHALLHGGVRLDLFFEALSSVSQQKRPAATLIVDKGRLARRLSLGWEAPVASIGKSISIIVRMTRQGGTWPLRTVRREQWSTFAMMELDLINAQIAQLMAVQNDPSNIYQNPFSLYRRLTAAQQKVLDDLTGEVLTGLVNRDRAALLQAHLRILDALISQGHAACLALGVDYPITPEGDAGLKALIVAGWPR